MKTRRRFIIQGTNPINNVVECVEEDLDGLVTAKTVSKDFRKYCGAYVRYMYDSNRAEWRIFYADENNIYLIYDDCIQSHKVPNGRVGGNIIKESKDLLSYQNLNGIENNNIKVVAYMLDRGIWNKFSDNRYAEYAIGGPTLDILLKSYNKKEEKNYMYRTSGEGYEISVDNGTTWEKEFVHLSITLAEDQNLHYGHYLDNSRYFCGYLCGYWLASPSANDVNKLLVIDRRYIYSRDFCYWSDFIKFRPLVCLKTDVKLKPVAENSYELVL